VRDDAHYATSREHDGYRENRDCDSVINGNVARLLFVGASFAHAVRTMAINLSLKLAALTAGGRADARAREATCTK